MSALSPCVDGSELARTFLNVQFHRSARHLPAGWAPTWDRPLRASEPTLFSADCVDVTAKELDTLIASMLPKARSQLTPDRAKSPQRVVLYRPGFKPNTQRLDPSGRRQMVTWPSGGATGIASSNGTNSPSIIQPVVADDARV